MGKKITYISFILVFCLIFTPILSTSATGVINVDEYNTLLDDYASELEKKYKINIEYPIRTDGYAAVGTATLSILDASLSYLSATFIQQLSTYYDKNYGELLTFEYTYLPISLYERDIAALGYFSSDTATIQLFIPTKGADMTMSGNSPVTILHEVGHAYHLFLSNSYGHYKLKNEWEKNNHKLMYGYFTHNPDRNTFISHYATMSYEEDFAETFAYAFSCNRSGLGLYPRLYRTDKSLTSLGEKIKIIEKKIPLYLNDTKGTLKTLDKMYAASTTLYYKGFYLSGNSLEYATFNQPTGILPAILASLKIDSTSTEWVREVGGWQVSDKNNGIYLVFPGSGYVTLRKPSK